MSFLNRKNILSEGFFDILKKLFNNSKLSSQDKKLEKTVDELEQLIKGMD